MGKSRRGEHKIRVFGEPRKDIEPDLMAQLVILLGRQLAREAGTDDESAIEPDDGGDSHP